jgi:hypothetical protein
MLSNASPNRSVIFEEKLNNDAAGEASCIGGEGNDGGGVMMPGELHDVEFALENKRLREELSDPNEDEREVDDEDEGTDASEMAGVTPRWIGFPQEMRFGNGAIFRRRAFCPLGISEAGAGTNVIGFD